MKKSKILFLYISLVSLLLLASFINLKYSNRIEFIEDKKSAITLNDSGSWNLLPFVIDDSGGGDYTWAEAVNESWCKGNGTLSNPYIIENLTINANGAKKSCIEIINSNVHFIVRNCYFYNTSTSGAYYAGINLQDTLYGKIFNNIIQDVASGVYFWRSDNLTISNNYVYNTVYCFYGVGEPFNISRNTVQDGEMRIREYTPTISSTSSIIRDNTLNDSKISIKYSEYVIIENNIINTVYASTIDAITLGQCKHAAIKNNTFIGGGISLSGTYDEIANHTIDKTNSVNNKTLYYYSKKENLSFKNFSEPGQIILVDCTNSEVTDINISKCGSSSIIGYYSKNISFSNNVLNENYRHAIDLKYCENVFIHSNQLDHNLYGIALDNCNIVNITDNNINDNIREDWDGRGVYLLESNNVSITRNEIHRNLDIGIHLEGSANCSLSHNNISQNRDGIILSRYQPSDTYSNFNSITYNNVYNNTQYGIFIYNGKNNEIFLNNFTQNLINANDNGLNNIWDNGTIGNYWDDYNGYDLNEDGIGDIPYNISGSSNSQDRFPIYLKDIIAPTWDQLPSDQFNEFGTSFYYDVNASDPSGIDTYWVNDTVNFQIDDSGVITNNTFLLIGEYWLEINVNDTSDNNITAIIKITIQDTTNPTWIEIPIDQFNELGTCLYYDVNASDLSSIHMYWLNDTVNFQIDINGVILNNTFLLVAEYWLEINVNDTSGNNVTAIIKITVQDTTKPIWVEIPSDQIIELGTSFSYDVNACDLSGIDSYWVNDTINFQIDSSGVITNNIALLVGDYWLEIRAYDPYGNYIAKTIKITVRPSQEEPTPPEVIPGYNTFILISILSISIIALITWNKKKSYSNI